MRYVIPEVYSNPNYKEIKENVRKFVESILDATEKFYQDNKSSETKKYGSMLNVGFNEELPFLTVPRKNEKKFKNNSLSVSLGARSRDFTLAEIKYTSVRPDGDTSTKYKDFRFGIWKDEAFLIKEAFDEKNYILTKIRPRYETVSEDDGTLSYVSTIELYFRPKKKIPRLCNPDVKTKCRKRKSQFFR